MTLIQIAKILEAHSIGYTIECGRILANDEYTIDGVLHIEHTDVTDMSMRKLFDWLGY